MLYVEQWDGINLPANAVIAEHWGNLPVPIVIRDASQVYVVFYPLEAQDSYTMTPEVLAAGEQYLAMLQDRMVKEVP